MVEGILIFLAFVFLSASVVLGVKWRKEKNNLLKEIIKSKQNIIMGLMSISTGLFFILSVTAIDFKLFISIFLLAVGIINLVQGIRMHRHYVKQLPHKTN